MKVFRNDGSDENMILLSGIKNLFQKQLPKMPREYIARLVFDVNHLSVAIVKPPFDVVGGITYRMFPQRGFAEIAFCAIASSEQVKGYGSHLMNHVKDYVKTTSPCMHFLTYADNYAIGYFKKQGFTKEVTLERSVWVGYIKDYEGGTIMHCSMLPSIRYLDSNKILAAQKLAIQAKIQEKSKSHIVYPGLQIFKEKSGIRVDPLKVPGIRRSGWTPEMDSASLRLKRPSHYATLAHILNELQNHPSAWPFVQPVNKEEVPDYYDLIKEPMDLATMESKLEHDKYSSDTGIKDFSYDFNLIIKNCQTYNNESTTYYKNAVKLDKFFQAELKKAELEA